MGARGEHQRNPYAERNGVGPVIGVAILHVAAEA